MEYLITNSRSWNNSSILNWISLHQTCLTQSSVKYDAITRSLVLHCMLIDQENHLRVAPYIAGDYFQVLRYIITPAAPMVRQQIPFIITPEWV